MINIGDDVDEIDDLKLQLAKKFEMKNLNIVHYSLGFEVYYSPNSFRDYLHFQFKYIANILEQTHMFYIRGVDNPFNFNVKHAHSDGVPLLDFTLYRTLVQPCVPYNDHT